MRIVVASCSVIYTGRGDTTLAQGIRAIMIKTDGAVSIHNDLGNKPLNYMGKGNVLTETVYDDHIVWSFDTRKESLQITLHEVISDSDFGLDLNSEGLVRDGTEPQLQAWLAANPEVLGAGYKLVQREYPTGAGPVDLLVVDAEGNPVAVEVKRVAMLPAVDQTRRYVEALKAKEGFENVRGLLVALDVRPNTVILADKRGLDYLVVSKSDFKKPADLTT